MRSLDEDRPRMRREPTLYNTPDGRLVWAWMRWYDECAPGMLRHMLPPEEIDALVVASGRPLTDPDGEPWFMVTGDTPAEAYEIIGVTPSADTLARLNETDRFHRKTTSQSAET